MDPLTPAQRVVAAELWPRIRHLARRLWRDEQAEGIAAEALCAAVAGWRGGPPSLATHACRFTFLAVLRAARRAPRVTSLPREPAAPRDLAVWEVLPSDLLAAVTTFVAHRGSRWVAERGAARDLGIPQREMSARLARAESLLEAIA